MAKSIKEICDIIEDFSQERGWRNDDPNQLITSIFIELGELAEHFQWKNKFGDLSEEEKKSIGFEFVDVMIYLFRFANKAGIDIEKYFDEKLPKLAEKFKVGATKEEYDNVRKRYREEGWNNTYDE